MILTKPSHKILTNLDYQAMLRRIEEAGRTCYKSEDKITEASAVPFVRRILKSGHESVIEHESLSVRFICDRGVTHEIVRHRLAAFSQESTRYCNYSGGVTFVIPQWAEDIEPGKYYKVPVGFKMEPGSFEWFTLMLSLEKSYDYLLKKDWSPQQARSVLPNSLKTEIVMTANIREWRHVLRLRTSKAAHPQMQELMQPLFSELKSKLPVFFEDIGVEVV